MRGCAGWSEYSLFAGKKTCFHKSMPKIINVWDKKDIILHMKFFHFFLDNESNSIDQNLDCTSHGRVSLTYDLACPVIDAYML